MLYQRKPLPPDIEYFLDCANEYDEIGAFAHNVLTLLGDRKIVAKIIDEIRPGKPLRGRREACLDLDAYAHELVTERSIEEQKAFAAGGMRWEPLHMLRLAEYLVHFNFEDETRGGAATPMRRHWRCDNNYDPTPRARRHLYAPSAIRRYARLEDQAIPYARIFARRMHRLPASSPAYCELIGALLREQREAYRQEYMAARAKFEGAQRRRFFNRREIGEQRRVVTKAAQFCAGLLGSDQVGAFARGEPVRLPCRDVVIEVARANSVASIGHGALDVRLCNHDGTRLAGLCVFFDQTPAIDQLAAIALHVQAGCEQEIIDTGNLYNVTNVGTEHPTVRARLAKNAMAEQRIDEAVRRLNGRRLSQSEHDKQLSAMRRYKAQTIQMYMDAVVAQVWGRNGHRILQPYVDDMLASSIADIQEMKAA